MNEQQPIFTPEQFRTQAVELSQAVAELHRRDSRMIDPHDPFENETEFHDYQSDYAEIVPQIRIPGCRIPLRANDREKSRIRRSGRSCFPLRKQGIRVQFIIKEISDCGTPETAAGSERNGSGRHRRERRFREAQEYPYRRCDDR